MKLGSQNLVDCFVWRIRNYYYILVLVFELIVILVRVKWKYNQVEFFMNIIGFFFISYMV